DNEHPAASNSAIAGRRINDADMIHRRCFTQGTTLLSRVIAGPLPERGYSSSASIRCQKPHRHSAKGATVTVSRGPTPPPTPPHSSPAPMSAPPAPASAHARPGAAHSSPPNRAAPPPGTPDQKRSAPPSPHSTAYPP